jgi:hypothetical protein
MEDDHSFYLTQASPELGTAQPNSLFLFFFFLYFLMFDIFLGKGGGVG